jgi:hypothetical protein
MFIFVAFAAILTLTFGTVALVTGTSRSQRVIDRRVAGILSPDQDAVAATPQIQLLLKTEEQSSFSWLTDFLRK